MRSLAILTTILFIAGCNTTATIKMKYSTVESKITGSDDMFVHLENGARIHKNSILDIDHPGNVHALVCAPLMVGGWVVALYYMDDYNKGHLYANVLGLPSLLVAIPSTIVSIWGFAVWIRSRIATGSLESTTRQKITPIALSDGERTYWGIGMSWRW